MELSEIIDYVLRTHNNVNPNILRGMMIRYQASDDVRFIIVDELPEQGEEKVIYLVPAYDPTLGDIYEEYIWIDGAYELLGHERRITIDDALSETSENPVQNRVVTAALNEKQDTLVSGTNIKTINGQSIVGEGNVETPTYTPFKSTWRHDTVTHLLADINADTSIAIGDNRFAIFKGDEKPESIFEKDIEQEILSVFSSDSLIALVFEDEDGENKFFTEVYDVKGNLVTTQGFDIDYSNISLYKDLIVIYNSEECQIYNTSGLKKFDGKFNESAVTVIPEGSTKYLVVYGDGMEEIKLK